MDQATEQVASAEPEAGRSAISKALGALGCRQIEPTSGEFSDDFFARPAPDPAQFGMPTADDGARGDPQLSDRSWAVSDYGPDFDALAAASTRVLIAVGEESMGTITWRISLATPDLLGQRATVFPSHHGGFMGGEFEYPGQPEAFARKLRDVLDEED